MYKIAKITYPNNKGIYYVPLYKGEFNTLYKEYLESDTRYRFNFPEGYYPIKLVDKFCINESEAYNVINKHKSEICGSIKDVIDFKPSVTIIDVI